MWLEGWIVNFFNSSCFHIRPGFFDCSNAVQILKWILNQPDFILWVWELSKVLSFQVLFFLLSKRSWMNSLFLHSWIPFCTAHAIFFCSLLYFFHIFIHKLYHCVKDCSILVSVTCGRSVWLESLVKVWCPWWCWHQILCTSAALPALPFVSGALFCTIIGIK